MKNSKLVNVFVVIVAVAIIGFVAVNLPTWMGDSATMSDDALEQKY
jgi:hypothetical protein